MSLQTTFAKFWSYLSGSSQNPLEKREGGSGFTHEYLLDRFDYLTGRRGLGELTATAAAACALWENAFALADVSGTTLLDPRTMAMAGRSLALRGEAVFWITDLGLIPCSSWALKTQYGQPVAYQLTIPEIGGGNPAQIALAAEVLHFRIGVDPHMPWLGHPPLRRAALTAGLLNAVESALAEVFEHSPLGSQIVPFPESPNVDMESMGRKFRGQRGRILLRESVNVTAAGGPTPVTDWRGASVSPDLSNSMTDETLEASRNGILAAFGILPAMFNSGTTGPLIREAQRHLAQWTLEPISELLEQEASEKLGAEIEIELIKPLHAYDEGGRSRALSTIVTALAEAKKAGLSPGDMSQALALVNWEES